MRLSTSKLQPRIVSHAIVNGKCAHGLTWLKFLLGRSVITIVTPSHRCNPAKRWWLAYKWLNAANYYKSARADVAFVTIIRTNKITAWKLHRWSLIAYRACDAMQRDATHRSPMHRIWKECETIRDRLSDFYRPEVRKIPTFPRSLKRELIKSDRARLCGSDFVDLVESKSK